MIVWQWLSHPWSVAVTAALLHFLWQGTLIALLGVLTVRCRRLATPHARYAAWMVVFAAMAAAPLVTLLTLDQPSDVRSPLAMDTAALPASSLLDGHHDENTGGNALSVVTESETDPAMWPAFVGWAVPTAVSSDVVGTAHPTKNLTWTAWQPYVLAAWGCGVMLLSTRLAVGVVWLIALSRQLQPVPEVLQQRFDRLVRRMGLRRSPRIVLSDRVVEPFAWQWLRPLVVLPASWLTDVPAEVLEAVVAHELAHIRRHDLWVNLLQRFIETVLFFHPCVWWVSRQIRAERELCCDAEAVAATGQAVAYARALETVAIRRMACAGPQLVVAMGGTRMGLLHRVKRVLGTETSAAESGWWSLGLAGVGVTAACWTAMTFATPTVQGDESPPAAVSADVVAQREEGPPPRGPREGDRPDAPRGPRDDGRSEEPRGPRDGERGPGPEGRPGPRPEFREGPPRGDFVPPAEVMHDMMRAIRELREEVHMLRRELNEIRERGPGGPGPRGPDNFFGPGRPGQPPATREGQRPGPEGRPVPRPEGREGDRGPGPEAREGNRGPRPEGRAPTPRSEGREGDRGPRPEGREGNRPRPPEGRDGDRPRPPEGRDGDRPRPPEGAPRDRRPDAERADDDKPVSALIGS